MYNIYIYIYIYIYIFVYIIKSEYIDISKVNILKHVTESFCAYNARIVEWFVSRNGYYKKLK